jgi:hypothetical protein
MSEQNLMESTDHGLRLTGGTTPVVPWSVDSMRFCSLIEGTSAA